MRPEVRVKSQHGPQWHGMHPVVAATPDEHSNPAEARKLDDKQAPPHDDPYVDLCAGIWWPGAFGEKCCSGSVVRVSTHSPDGASPTAGSVRRHGAWAVGTSNGQDFAVSRRCRHQLADLSAGHIDAEGCLVCPWHQSRYDVSTGAMVTGPQGVLGYHGRTPGYTQLVLAYGRRLRLRVGRLVRTAGGVDVR